jgi:hypothetical protein
MELVHRNPPGFSEILMGKVISRRINGEIRNTYVNTYIHHVELLRNVMHSRLHTNDAMGNRRKF